MTCRALLLALLVWGFSQTVHSQSLPKRSEPVALGHNQVNATEPGIAYAKQEADTLIAAAFISPVEAHTAAETTAPACQIENSEANKSPKKDNNRSVDSASTSPLAPYPATQTRKPVPQGKEHRWGKKWWVAAALLAIGLTLGLFGVIMLFFGLAAFAAAFGILIVAGIVALIGLIWLLVALPRMRKPLAR